MKKGTLLVIEGGDGAGKGTQLSLLVQYCQKNKIPYQTFDFPQYGKTFFGDFCGRFLNGEFGSITDVSPYIITIPYAADRWQAKKEIEQALKEGKLVLVNRYVPSNAAYQAAKLPAEKRQAFIDWEFQMEYQEFGIPKEDVVVYLDVPVAVSQHLIETKDKRGYLDGAKKKDIHEQDVQFLTEVESVYTSFCQQFSHWICVSCVEDNRILTKEDIHQKVITELQEKNII